MFPLMRTIFLAVLVFLPENLAQAKEPAVWPAYDTVIRNGRIVDGTGAPWYYGDIGIRDGKIAKIGRIDPKLGMRIINAQGLVVAPGFIDMMGQTATPFLTNPAAAMNLLTQGITTINAGEGVSAAPLSPANGKRVGWKTMAEYFSLLEKKGMPINIVQTVGHSQVRKLVLGEADRRPTANELKRMQAYVREAMHAGAIGLSTALIYPPAVYANTEEIAALVKVAGESGGRYYTHMRNEGDLLLEAIDEALEIGKSAGTPVHIFHLKAAGKQNWGKMNQAIAKIKAARLNGQQVAADIYPYINNGLGITAFMHPRNFTEGREKLRRSLSDAKTRKRIRAEMESEKGWENWFRHVDYDWDKVVLGSMTAKLYANYNGKSLKQIALSLKKDPWDTFFDIAGVGAFALPQSMSEANKIRAMKQEFISFCTDVGPAGGNTRISSHPRAYGSFPRILSHYVRDLGVLSLEQAISQMSSVAANEIMAYDRGNIAVGLAADIVIFDFQRIADKATLANPRVESVGMKFVLVNGITVLANGNFTGKTPGKVLRGPGYRSGNGVIK